MFGGDWCGWCHKLHDLFTTNREIRQTLGNEYVLVTIDTASPNATEVLETCKAALSKDDAHKGFGYPFLAVLDAQGKVVKAQRTDPLEEGDHHDPKKVQEFLDGWKVAPKDARVVLKEALSRASSDDKRVLLTFGAPWCGWCHKLHDWMAQPEIAAILDRDFVIAQVDVDRMTGGKEVQKHYQPATSGGIPWFAILDTRGKALITSDGPGGNIGYPAQPREVEHFLSMVKGQGRRIDDRQLDQLRKSLDEAAERIKRQSAVEHASERKRDGRIARGATDSAPLPRTTPLVNCQRVPQRLARRRTATVSDERRHAETIRTNEPGSGTDAAAMAATSWSQ